jgi:predicted nucleic-acid-binding Zn-ribbon protein
VPYLVATESLRYDHARALALEDRVKDIGKLADDDILRFWDWYGEYRKNQGDPIKTCPFCGRAELDIADHAVDLTTRGPPQTFGRIIAQGSHPSILVICQNCGYSQLFNALIVFQIEPPGDALNG